MIYLINLFQLENQKVVTYQSSPVESIILPIDRLLLTSVTALLHAPKPLAPMLSESCLVLYAKIDELPAKADNMRGTEVETYVLAKRNGQGISRRLYHPCGGGPIEKAWSLVMWH